MYGKLFTSMYDGTLVENWEALVTFQQMIILSDAEGVVDMTPRALTARTGIPIEIISKGIKALESDDPYSRTKTMNGIRIERLDEHRPWGWKIVNHSKYRQIQGYEDKKEADRNRMRKKRTAEKLNKINDVAMCSNVSHSVASVADVAYTDTNTDTNTDTKKEREEKKRKKLSPLSKLWNEICLDSPKVIEITKGRMKKEKLRLKERPFLEWEPIFNKISLSKFCLGDNDRGWKATFDWIIDKQDNALKVIEGKYDSKNKLTRVDEINNTFAEFKKMRALKNEGR